MALADAFQFVALSDCGQVRDHNEDSVAFVPALGLAVLADGMGGYNAGEVASAMMTSGLIESVSPQWRGPELAGADREAAKSLSQACLQAQIQAVNAEICRRAQEDAACEGMCTTLVACLFYDNFVTVAHIGDSRLYRLRGDSFEQVTKDHSLVQEQIDAGLIRSEDAHLSNNRNVVTRAVGIDPETQAEIHTYDAEPGDIYLLCSDGLHGMLPDEEIQMAVGALQANLQLCADHLVQSANDAGGHDNVSVILVKVLTDYAAA